MLRWTEKKTLVIQKDYGMVLDLNTRTLSSSINTGRASLFCLLLHKHLLHLSEDLFCTKINCKACLYVFSKLPLTFVPKELDCKPGI